MEELIKNNSWKKHEVIHEKSSKLPNLRKKYLFSIGGSIFLLLITYIILLFRGEGNGVFALILIGNLLAFAFGGIIVTLLIIFYNNVMISRSRKEMSKCYSRLINSDIERIYKTFKDKKFSLMRIGKLTIFDNWVIVLSNISLDLSEKELDIYVSFYKQLDNINIIRNEFNGHIKALEGISFKEYPNIKEYNNSIALLTKEFNKLFSIEIEDLTRKLNKLSNFQ